MARMGRNILEMGILNLVEMSMANSSVGSWFWLLWLIQDVCDRNARPIVFSGMCLQLLRLGALNRYCNIFSNSCFVSRQKLSLHSLIMETERDRKLEYVGFVFIFERAVSPKIL